MTPKGTTERNLSSEPVRELVEALRKFIDKVKSTEKPVNACIQISAIHGCPYKGPNWSEELAEAERVLARYQKV